jgi:hypothetical protein
MMQFGTKTNFAPRKIARGCRGEYRNRPVCGQRLHVTLTIALLLLLAGTPALTLGQPPAPRPFRVGVLHGAFVPMIPPVEGLKTGLKALGREEGRDVVYKIRFTRGNSEAAMTEASELVKGGVDVICPLTPRSSWLRGLDLNQRPWVTRTPRRYTLLPLVRTVQ